MDKNYFKAAILKSTEKKRLDFQNLNYPNLKRGQVLVKMIYAGLCRSQLMEIYGKRGKDNWIPHLLGHEGVGSVVKVGRDVKKINVGDKVILSWIKSDGIESQKPYFYGNLNKQKINAGNITTFSEYTVVSENRVIKKPSYISDKLSSIIGCSAFTGIGLVVNEIYKKYKHLKKEKILLLGAGGIGFFVLVALRNMKIINNVKILDISKQKLNLANKLGYKKTFNNTKKINEKFDIVIDTSGSINAMNYGFNALNNYGSLFFVSHPPKGEKLSIDPHELISGKNIYGSWGGSVNPDKDIKKFSKIILEKKIKNLILENFVNLYEFQNLNTAINDFYKNQVFRPVVYFN